MHFQGKHKKDLKNQILGVMRFPYLMKYGIKNSMIIFYLSSDQI